MGTWYLEDERPLAVVKLGSSVLRDPSDLPVATAAIYSQLVLGRRVVAVVSAMGNETDDLLRAAEVAGGDAGYDAARLLATGEERSGLLLAMALQRAGIPARFVDAREAGLRTTGSSFDAQPVALAASNLHAMSHRHAVLVLPGFTGVDDAGRVTLLGRGGSDLSALFIARELDAVECVLCKDVDGLYAADPATSDRPPARFGSAHWTTAETVAGPLVQDRALRFAAENGITFRIAGPLASGGTTVGGLPDRYRGARDARRLKVGLLGAGTVGGGVLRKLHRLDPFFDVTAVAVRDLDKPREDLPGSVPLTDDLHEVLDSGCEVLVEVMGGIDPAGTVVASALARGISVVTANKALIAEQGAGLERVAERTGAFLLYSAAVGGGMPALEAAGAALTRGDIRRVRGVVNGTCNFVLGELAEGKAFDDAVRAAQEAGFAEADPSLDIDGHDSASKLAILARALWRRDVEPATEGIRGVASLADPSPTTRLVAEASFAGGRLHASVAPAALEADDFLTTARGAGNCLEIETTGGTVLRALGDGAGRWPTALAVMSDLARVQASQGTLRTAHDVDPVSRSSSAEGARVA